MASRRAAVAAIVAGVIVPIEVTRAQARRVPLIGFLRSTPAGPFAHIVAAFRRGVAEAGLVEGPDVAIEFRWADNKLDRLPALARELALLPVAVLVGNGIAVDAAKAVASDIPIVFVIAEDPIQRGLVKSMSRPGGNLTGVTFFGGGQLGAKRVELLLQLVPSAGPIALLFDPTSRASEAELPDAQAAVSAAGRAVVVVRAASDRDFAAAFDTMVRENAVALVVAGSPVFTSNSGKLVALAARHRIPAIYDVSEHTRAGGLMSYAASFADAYRQAGVYAARIVKGARPAELPVLQPSKFELALNLGTAKALGLTVPPSLLLRADEVIQ